MWTFGITTVLIAYASIVSGLTLEHIENGKICTAWQFVSNGPAEVSPSVCSSALGYELNTYNSEYIVRFCCSYNSVPQPIVGPPPTGCGRQAVTPIRSRIVGGQEAVPHSWPWLVSLQYHGQHFCGGTLIDAYHVLTAAHCLQDQSMFNTDFTIVAGLHTKSNPNPQRVQRKQVAQVINHGGYNDETSQNDIAIIRLTTPVTLNSYVNIACLPGSDPAVNQNVMIAGWGTTTYEGNAPDSLRQASILIMDVCKQVYGYYDTSKQLCAGNYQYSKDSCQGDSGGPLMSEVNGQWLISGVVSYGDECAKVNRPGVYARVSYYLPWIQSVISGFSG